MDKSKERIRWSPRIRPALIKRLYESDARGLQDDELCNEVGFRLFLRCQSIVMVSRDEVACPRCGTVFVVKTLTRDEVSVCPARDCAWQTTMVEFLDRLTGVDPGRKEEWRETMQQMMRRRKGK